MGRFDDCVVVVTGAGSGIGAATARRFASEGAIVVLADIDEARASVGAEAIKAEGGSALAWQLDVGDARAWARLSAALRERFGRVDVVHNNAYTIERLAAGELTEASWDRQIAVNLSSVYHSVRALISLMTGDAASMVNTSSVHAVVGAASHPAYAASKGGILALTRQLAVEYGPRIRVNAVLPGPIATAAWDGLSDDDVRAAASATVAGRLGNPEEVAAVVCFLASRDASYITGTGVLVDGGYVATRGAP